MGRGKSRSSLRWVWVLVLCVRQLALRGCEWSRVLASLCVPVLPKQVAHVPDLSPHTDAPAPDGLHSNGRGVDNGW